VLHIYSADNHIVRNNILMHGYIKFKGYNLEATGNIIVAQHQDQEWGCLLLLATHREPANWVYQQNLCFLDSDSLPPYVWRSSSQTLCEKKDFDASNNVNLGFRFNPREWRCGDSLREWMQVSKM
jgi:hypothetical protein